MKHTFEYKGKQKTVEIPDEWIASQRNNLKLSYQEAIDLWLFDNDYVSNAGADALTAKAAAVPIKHDAERKPRKAPERKPDYTKRAIVEALLETIKAYEGVRSPQITNVERMISFSLGDDDYEITLSKKRKQR